MLALQQPSLDFYSAILTPLFSLLNFTEYLNLYDNQLTGTVPSALRLRRLFLLDLGRNQLTGQLPDDLGEKFVSLRILSLSHNKFSGTLPPSYINVGNGRLARRGCAD